MRYELTDYQREATVGVLERLRWCGEDWRTRRERSSFALSAITGAGKTVIATAAIEASFFGSSDLDAEHDPRAAFLWITDDPALNRQTRNRMLAASDFLTPGQLIEINDGFLDQVLSPGQVYFLNTQKLSKTSRLVQNTNLRQLTFWDLLANTVASEDITLYLILDEAHRGMRRSPDRATIVQRLIHGEPGSNPPIPVVWGISATIARFTTAMGQTIDRTARSHVDVDIEKVRASGLVKDGIGLDQPIGKGTFSTTLLRDAVRATRDYERRWAAYSEKEGEPQVLPVLVIQVPDRASPAKLAEIVQAVESEWPELGPDAVASVFGEHEPIVLTSRTVRWVYPESIQEDNGIRVVLAKQAISTGWDCPRAEVLYSERPARDSTHIAQVIGRMVRQPLAHRIATDDVLNTVSCYLPLFDRNALASIKEALEGTGKGNGDHQVGPEVLLAPINFGQNPHVPEDVLKFIETLPSIPTPDPLASPLRRAKHLVRLLSDDASGKALLPDADEQLSKSLFARLDGLAAEHKEAVDARVTDIKTVSVRREVVPPGGHGEAEAALRSLGTHAKDIDRDTRKVIRAVKEGVGEGYLRHQAESGGQDLLDVRIEVAALLGVDGVLAEIDAAATRFVTDLLAKFAVEIKNTTGATRAAYRLVQEQTTNRETLTIDLRPNEKAATKDGKGNDLPLFEGHIYADGEGKSPAKLNDWESTVIATETARPSFVAWYRNPQRAMPNSLRIAYQNESDRWKSLQVDFLIISKLDDQSLAASIVDPHGDHLADAKAKLRALAQFADDFGDRFVRIESVTEVDGELRVLDLLDEQTREAVRAFEGGRVSPLYTSTQSRPYE
jgi:hypothetical protein